MCGAVARQTRFEHSKLPHAAMSQMDASNADFSNANMQSVTLVETNLAGVALDKSNMRGSWWKQTSVNGASLKRVNLIDAKLIEIDLNTLTTMEGMLGNGQEIKNLLIDTLPITYTATRMQIGHHIWPLEKWWQFDTELVRGFVCGLMPFDQGTSTIFAQWDRFKPLLAQVIETSPAVSCQPEHCQPEHGESADAEMPSLRISERAK